MTELGELRARHTALAKGMLPAYIERLSWDAATLAEHRSEALRALLKVAAERSAWHRERLAGLPLDAVGPQDLTALPTMTKRDVMTQFDRIVIDPRVTLRAVEDLLAAGAGGYLFDEYTAAATAGSTGGRTVMLYDRLSLAVWWLSVMRPLLAWRSRRPDLDGRPLVVCYVSAAHSSHITALLASTFGDPHIRNVGVPVTLPIATIVERLNETQPEILVAYPSAWASLAREAAAGRLRIAPRQVFSGGEPLLPEIRAAIAEHWPVPLFNGWGSTEACSFTQPCERGFSHLAADLTIVEPVDAAGNPVPPGVRSAKILVTNLFNHALPLIRYEITDEVTVLPGACECGSPNARVADIQGRLDDWFHYPCGDVHPHVFRSVLGREPGIVEYQVRQTERGAVVAVRCAREIDLTHLQATLRADLIAAGLPEPEVRVEAVETLERLAHTGKLRRFVPLAVRS